jgi:hypothetical protein
MHEKHGVESIMFSPEVMEAIREVARTKRVPDRIRRVAGKEEGE